MSAGEALARAHSQAARATGRLALMIETKRIRRTQLDDALGDLEAASAILKEIIDGSTLRQRRQGDAEED